MGSKISFRYFPTVGAIHIVAKQNGPANQVILTGLHHKATFLVLGSFNRATSCFAEIVLNQGGKPSDIDAM